MFPAAANSPYTNYYAGLSSAFAANAAAAGATGPAPTYWNTHSPAPYSHPNNHHAVHNGHMAAVSHHASMQHAHQHGHPHGHVQLQPAPVASIPGMYLYSNHNYPLLELK